MRDLTRMRVLRGLILRALYVATIEESLGGALSQSALEGVLHSLEGVSLREGDLEAALRYLESKGLVAVQWRQGYAERIQLSPTGVDVVEGNARDPGVIL